MMYSHSKQNGFTAIELLITLFIAAAFLVSGYQLYSVIIRDSGNARAQSRASNTAYDYLRRYASSATNPCTTTSPLTDSEVSVAGLSSVTVSVDITCPYPSTANLSKVSVTVKYNNPQQTVTYANYANAGTTDDSISTLESGLVGWWKFNGNAEDSAGTADGVVNGPTLTAGQNGKDNGAYNFDGVNDYIEVSASSLTSFTNFSVSAWARVIGGPAATSGHGYIIHRGIDTSQGSSVFWMGALSTSPFYAGGVNGFNASGYTSIGATTATWRLVTMTYNGNDVINYIDGQSQASYSPGAITNSTANNKVGIGGTPFTPTYRPALGDIDDVRIYNRTLTPVEVATLYSEGAQ